MVRSRELATESHLTTLLDSTRGIIFLGTPHKGAELAAWANRLARVFGVLKQTNAAIVNQLSSDSPELEKIQDSFDNLLRSRVVEKLPPIEVMCFFEEKSITGVGQVRLQRVPCLRSLIPNPQFWLAAHL